MGQSFPTTNPTYPDTTGAETLGTAGGGYGLSRILDDYGLDISAIAAKVGTGSSTASAGKVLRATGTGTSTWGAVDLTTDVTGILPVANGGTGASSLTGLTLTSLVINTSVSGTAVLDEDDMTSNSATKLATQQSIKAYIDAQITAAKSSLWPVNSLYYETSGTNPGTTLGFGTWSEYGQGTFLVSHSSSGTFNVAAGTTGGVESVTLTAAQSGLPAHSHTEKFSSGANNGVIGIAQTGSQSTAPGINSTYTTANNTAASASESHTNLPPYTVVYVWQRTA